MSDQPTSPANECESQNPQWIKVMVRNGASLASACRELASCLDECAAISRKSKLSNEELSAALPLMCLTGNAGVARLWSAKLTSAACRLEALPASAGDLAKLMSGDGSQWSALESLIVGEASS